MAAIQATTATTLNSSPERKKAAGRNTKWKWKLAEPTPTPLRNAGVESCRASKETINRTDSLRNGEVGRGTRTLRRAKIDHPYSPGIFLGTSSFTATGWQGSFYPQGMRSRDFLSHYASQFQAVEIDNTFYVPAYIRN
jgi:hypothetical protein